MKIDLRRLYGLKELDIDENITIPEELYSKMGVNSMEDVNVSGKISINYEDNIVLDLVVNGKFIMPCSVTFELLKIPFEVKIDEEILENSLKDEFFLDLLDVLWENIVLEIPFNVVKEGAKIETQQGEGWELRSEE